MVRAFIQTQKYDEAYRLVYAKPDTKQETCYTAGYRIMHRPHIREFYQEALENGAQLAAITVEAHLRELANIRDLAIRNNDHATALKAERSRGEVGGYYNDSAGALGLNVHGNVFIEAPDQAKSESAWEREMKKLAHHEVETH